MELVSTLCFGGNSPPGEGIINKLMSYITKARDDQGGHRRVQTRQMTAFKDSIDATPVVRSFLLQLLLRSK